MSEIVVNTVKPTPSYLEGGRERLLRHVVAALLVGSAYYIGAKIGFALTFQPHPVSTLCRTVALANPLVVVPSACCVPCTSFSAAQCGHTDDDDSVLVRQ